MNVEYHFSFLTSHLMYLRKVLRSVALVRRHNLATSNLLVGVSGPSDAAVLVVNHSQGGEAVAGTELPAPARGDGVVAKVLGGAVVLRGRGSSGPLGDEVDGGLGVDLGVDLEGPVALVVGAVADTLDALDGPLGDAGGHHGLFRGGGSRNHGGGGEEGGDDGLSELHVGGCGCGWFVSGMWFEVGLESE